MVVEHFDILIVIKIPEILLINYFRYFFQNHINIGPRLWVGVEALQNELMNFLDHFEFTTIIHKLAAIKNLQILNQPSQPEVYDVVFEVVANSFSFELMLKCKDLLNFVVLERSILEVVRQLLHVQYI